MVAYFLGLFLIDAGGWYVVLVVVAWLVDFCFDFMI